MILYFTGTGNSGYVADRLAEALGEDEFSMNDAIREGRIESIEAERLIFVVPTYAWKIPRIVEEWIRKVSFANETPSWFVMTCGGSIGGAPSYNSALCADKNLKYMGTWELVMPENYIAMFDVPDEAESAAIIGRAEPQIDSMIELLREGNAFPEKKAGAGGKAMSKIVNSCFFTFVVKADKFRATDNCTGCGICAGLCPLNNIRIVDGKPSWGKECTHCMACICRCPSEAIEYGKKSVGKRRYVCAK